MTNSQIYLNPSFYAHIINALLLLLALIIIIKNYKIIKHIEPYKIIIIVLLFSIVIGIHGLLHLGQESIYGFNPIRNLLL